MSEKNNIKINSCDSKIKNVLNETCCCLWFLTRENYISSDQLNKSEKTYRIKGSHEKNTYCTMLIILGMSQHIVYKTLEVNNRMALCSQLNYILNC